MAKGIMYVDGIRIPFDGEPSVLAVIQKAGIEMPNFCFHSDLSVYGACRMCMVEDEKGGIDAACTMTPKDGLRVQTNTARLLKYRRLILELLLAAHCRDCTTCEKNGSCRLQDMSMRFGVRHVRFNDTRRRYAVDDSGAATVLDMNKCILCGDCVRVCKEVQGMNILRFVNRGPELTIGTEDGRKISATHCVSCGQCAAVCTTGAITVKNEIGKAWHALHDPKLRVVVQIAPAVRVAVGEAFGIPAGENTLDKLVTALKIMGADEVYDTTFGADITVIEEAAEFMERLEHGGTLPMFTSCCPVWVKFVENEAPDFLPNLSTCKSPMEMFASVLKDRYADKDALDGRTTYHIAIMPCTAKKMEAGRAELGRGGAPEVDLVLTTLEIINMIKESGIQFPVLERESPDLPFGMGSGAATIFGTSSGVAEAVLRHCLPDKSKNALRAIEVCGLRGSESVRTATVQIGERQLRVAAVYGLANVRKLLDDIRSGAAQFDLVEVMSCRTGCVGGAGQPQGLMERKLARAAGLYELDHTAMFKRAERNPVVQNFYEEGLRERAHELLHVAYQKSGDE